MLFAGPDRFMIGGAGLLGGGVYALGLGPWCGLENERKIELCFTIPHAATKAFSPNSILFSMCSLM